MYSEDKTSDNRRTRWCGRRVLDLNARGAGLIPAAGPLLFRIRCCSSTIVLLDADTYDTGILVWGKVYVCDCYKNNNCTTINDMRLGSLHFICVSPSKSTCENEMLIKRDEISEWEPQGASSYYLNIAIKGHVDVFVISSAASWLLLLMPKIYEFTWK